VHATTDPKTDYATPDVEVGTDHPNRLIEFRIRRHGPMNNPNIDMAFADFSVRPVGLKELWSLNWHRTWRKERTEDGGMPKMIGEEYWPEFMKGYSDAGVLDYQ